MLLRVALLFTLLTPLLHAATLIGSELTLQDPISGLSQTPLGLLHSISLALFAAAHLLLAVALRGRDRGWCWPVGRCFLALAGICLLYVMVFFATTPLQVLSSPDANDPLWLLAILIGLAMGSLQPGFARMASALARFNLWCLVAWIGLVPAILLIDIVF